MSTQASGRWTSEDVETLRKMIGKRQTAEAISRKLGRTPNAIQKKAHSLGISVRAGGVMAKTPSAKTPAVETPAASPAPNEHAQFPQTPFRTTRW